MRFALFFVAVLCLFQYGYTYCCFRTQPATACAVVETPCVSAMSGCCNGCGNSCGNSCGGGCGNSYTNNCGCSAPCGCYRDASNVCSACKPKSSPVCSCLKECGCNSMIYFPEVQYPVTVMEMCPNYYGACWSY